MIADTERAYLNRIRDYFGAALIAVDTHPGDWSDQALGSMMLSAPSVYAAWLGAGEPRTRGRMVSHWVFYVTGHMLNGSETDRPGLYQVAARLLAVLSGFQAPGASPLTFERAANLYSEKQAGAGVVLYGIYFSCEEIIDPITDIATLDEFLRHYQTFGAPDGTPQLQAHIALPEPGDKQNF